MCLYLMSSLGTGSLSIVKDGLGSEAFKKRYAKGLHDGKECFGLSLHVFSQDILEGINATETFQIKSAIG